MEHGTTDQRQRNLCHPAAACHLMFCISNKWHNEPRLYSLLHLCTSLSTRCHTGWKQHQIIGSRDANKLPGTIRRRRKVPEGGHGCWSCTVETQQHTSGLRPCSGCHLKLVWEIWSSVTNLNCLRVRAEHCDQEGICMTHSTTGKTPDYYDIKSLALCTWRSFRRLRVGMRSIEQRTENWHSDS